MGKVAQCCQVDSKKVRFAKEKNLAQMQKNGRKTSDQKFSNAISAPNYAKKYNSEDEDEDKFLNPQNFVHQPVEIMSEPDFVVPTQDFPQFKNSRKSIKPFKKSIPMIDDSQDEEQVEYKALSIKQDNSNKDSYMRSTKRRSPSVRSNQSENRSRSPKTKKQRSQSPKRKSLKKPKKKVRTGSVMSQSDYTASVKAPSFKAPSLKSKKVNLPSNMSNNVNGLGINQLIKERRQADKQRMNAAMGSIRPPIYPTLDQPSPRSNLPAVRFSNLGPKKQKGLYSTQQTNSEYQRNGINNGYPRMNSPKKVKNKGQKKANHMNLG